MSSLSLINKTGHLYCSMTKMLDILAPVLDIILRIWVAKVFFQSGLTKIQSWDTTMMLFQYEYNVPILSPSLISEVTPGNPEFANTID